MATASSASTIPHSSTRECSSKLGSPSGRYLCKKRPSQLARSPYRKRFEWWNQHLPLERDLIQQGLSQGYSRFHSKDRGQSFLTRERHGDYLPEQRHRTEQWGSDLQRQLQRVVSFHLFPHSIDCLQTVCRERSQDFPWDTMSPNRLHDLGPVLPGQNHHKRILVT